MDELRCALELRADDSMTSPGRLTGVLLTYGERASTRSETFAQDALKWPTDGIVLRRQHQRGAPIMRVVPELRGSQIVIDVPLAGHRGRPRRCGRDPGRSVSWPVGRISRDVATLRGWRATDSSGAAQGCRAR